MLIFLSFPPAFYMNIDDSSTGLSCDSPIESGKGLIAALCSEFVMN